MDIFNALRDDYVRIGVPEPTRDGVLREIARLAKAAPALAALSERDVYNALLDRERLGTTAFGDEVAIPHCRSPKVTAFVVGIIAVPEGVDFQALDGQPVKLFFFIIAPEAESDAHVRLLSLVSRVIAQPGVRAELLTAKNAVGLREAFLRHVPDELTARGAEERMQVAILVQTEEYFMDVLQVVSSLESASVAVIEGGNVGRYLHAMPLFSSFWSGEEKGFMRLITGVVGKNLANEMIRGIDQAVGGLDESSGILVTVQNLHYVGGSLRN